MKESTIELLACPGCHGALAFIGTSNGELRGGTLNCSTCQQDFPILNGIPRFIQPKALTGFNRRFAYMYDWFSWGYRLFSKIAFVFIGMSEESGRREITDRLEPQGGRMLEVWKGWFYCLEFRKPKSEVLL